MLRPVNNEATIGLVWIEDEAIDPAKSDKKAYIQALYSGKGDWQEHLVMRDGARPTVFKMGVIPPVTMAELLATMTSPSPVTNFKAFCHGLRDIENPGWLAVDTTDHDGRSKQVVPKITVNGLEYVDPVWLAKVMTRNLVTCAATLGACALVWNTLTEADVKN